MDQNLGHCFDLFHIVVSIDRRSQILISENSYGAPIGSVQISLDRFNNEAMVNAIVDQHRRGRSLGSVLINAAVDYIFTTTPTQRVIAKIRAGNTAGERSFRLAGFNTVAPTIVRNVMASQLILDWLTTVAFKTGCSPRLKNSIEFPMSVSSMFRLRKPLSAQSLPLTRPSSWRSSFSSGSRGSIFCFFSCWIIAFSDTWT